MLMNEFTWMHLIDEVPDPATRSCLRLLFTKIETSLGAVELGEETEEDEEAYGELSLSAKVLASVFEGKREYAGKGLEVPDIEEDESEVEWTDTAQALPRRGIRVEAQVLGYKASDTIHFVVSEPFPAHLFPKWREVR